ncbi:HAD-IC family P-type ATPase [Candidatus Woesearchaeota archaeon]|nr:HAD-IC family P-type ATPase [Candidatus Woesearchaeota archaeon]
MNEQRDLEHVQELPVENVLELLNTSLDGLSQQEAARRLKIYGANKLSQEHKLNVLKLFLSQFSSALVWLLIAAAVISFFLKESMDATAIIIILLLNAVLGFFQEFKAEKSLEALKKLSAPKALVLRSGKEMLIDAELLVPGDVILLQEGSKVPADARIVKAEFLKVMESILTGESVPVVKKPGVCKKQSVSEQFNMLFAGTDVVSGNAVAVVVRTGMNTEIGKIAKLVTSVERVETPLQKKLEVLSKQLGLLVILISIGIFLVNFALKTGSLINSFLVAVSLAVAAVPEGLPAVVTIALSIGMRRMAKRKALVKKLLSVETLGSATVICSDKTGTLTKNEMTVKKVFCNSKTIDVSGVGYAVNGSFTEKPDDLLLNIGVLCNNADLNHVSNNKVEVFGDPTEIALLISAEKAGLNVHDLRLKYKKVFEIPFSSERKMMTTLHFKDEKTLIVATKGAPEVVLNHCSKYLHNNKQQALTHAKKQEFLAKNNEFASHALRVLAFAFKELRFKNNKAVQEFIARLKQNPDKETLNNLEQGLTFIGLQAMIDPPRPEAVKAISLCQKAGIKVVMITGDHLSTAKAVAEQLGIKGRAVHADQLKHLNLEQEVENIAVYARVNPDHKLQIVQALQKHGHIVAMTGDGVNDAPALKKADIGVAVGSGTDVAKEASDVVLLDDNFATIVSAVEQGRTIFDNIKKFVAYLLFANFGEVLLLLFTTILLFAEHVKALPLTALQILWINLVTDSFPALALGVDPKSQNVMNRPPRKPSEHILSKDLQVLTVFNGLLLAVAATVLFFVTSKYFSLQEARTLTVTLVVLIEAAYVQSVRELYNQKLFSNKWVVLSVIGVVLLQVIAVHTALRKIFKFTVLTFQQWVYVLIIAIIVYYVSLIVSKFLSKLYEPHKH